MENGEKPKRFEQKPNIELTQRLSRDGRFWIFKRVETWLVSAKYLDVIRENHGREQNGTQVATVEEKSKRKGKRNADSDG
ncbi:MAG: hypothetical protein AB7O96_03670 [Pseudobdellovibrionaceae bacterium]